MNSTDSSVILLDEIVAECGYAPATVPSDVKERLAVYKADGIYRLKRLAGADIDFDEDRNARMLLKTYCRYANAHALEQFETDYLSELTDLNIKYRELEESEEAGENEQ